jgi:hypothetical protein
MSCLITDVLTGALAPGVCNAAVNAGGKLLKVVEMQYRYGKPSVDGAKSGAPELQLVPQDIPSVSLPSS